MDTMKWTQVKHPSIQEMRYHSNHHHYLSLHYHHHNNHLSLSPQPPTWWTMSHWKWQSVKKTKGVYVQPSLKPSVQIAESVKFEEPHADGASHYHACIATNGQMRWSQPRTWMASNGVNFHISDSHLNYVDMYRYAKTTDTEAIESDNHCNLDTISTPRTEHAQRTN